MMTNKTSKYALISVYEKKGIIKLASNLIKSGYKIIATEGTGEELKKRKIPFISCQKISKNPNCFDGYMKSMSFPIESGIIFDRLNPVHIKEAKKLDIKQIDIVVCNFFPLKEAIACSKTEDVKNIIINFDFGGPTMVRVAAQNFKNVIIAVDASDYKKIEKAILSNNIPDRLKYYLATKAFEYVLDYDTQIFKYLNESK
jgi:phosphoribosylaminoimidazolecarboxamide formyltransferase / IMP cyclohydrolase